MPGFGGIEFVNPDFSLGGTETALARELRVLALPLNEQIASSFWASFLFLQNKSDCCSKTIIRFLDKQ